MRSSPVMSGVGIDEANSKRRSSTRQHAIGISGARRTLCLSSWVGDSTAGSSALTVWRPAMPPSDTTGPPLPNPLTTRALRHEPWTSLSFSWVFGPHLPSTTRSKSHWNSSIADLNALSLPAASFSGNGPAK